MEGDERRHGILVFDDQTKEQQRGRREIRRL
jgi:hypothetical protein